MELAVYAANAAQLEGIQEALRPIPFRQAPQFVLDILFGNDCDAEYLGNLVSLDRLMAAGLDLTQISRLYFGQEFCQFLIPSPEQVLHAYFSSRQLGWGFTYVTGPVTESGMEPILRNLELLAGQEDAADIELVVNDWGVLQKAREVAPVLAPVLGRLLLKQPRLARSRGQPPVNRDGLDAGAETAGAHQMAEFRGIDLSIPCYRTELCASGVTRFEVDIVPQGVCLAPDGWGFGASAYFPWSYVCGGRNCLTAALEDPHRKFLVTDAACGRLCQTLNRATALATTMHGILERGNSVFLLNCDYAEPYLTGAIPVDRIVFQPLIPI